MEKLAYNAAQGARLPDGRGISYLTSDTRLYATADLPDSHSLFAGGHGRFKISPTHEDVACCCNPNAVRLMPHFVRAMWMQVGDSGLAAVLYGPCSLAANIGKTAVTVTEKTDYPFADEIIFEIEPEHPVRFALLLRRPDWVTTMYVDGAVANGDMVTVDRLWSRGDRLTVRFETVPRLVSYATGEVAVFRGPLQYVQPISAARRILKDYPRAGFHDCELVPSGVDELEHVPVVSPDGVGLSWSRDAGIDSCAVWSKPGVRVNVGSFVLVPMGSALLRRAAFARV
jgi:DUF1680 family protein